MWQYIKESEGPVVEVIHHHTGEKHTVDLYEENHTVPYP